MMQQSVLHLRQPFSDAGFSIYLSISGKLVIAAQKIIARKIVKVTIPARILQEVKHKIYIEL